MPTDTIASTDTPKTFWSSTTGSITKFAALLTALTTISAFFKPVIGYVGDVFHTHAVVNDASTTKIKSVITDYYMLDDKEDFKQYAELFSDPVQNYFGQAHVTREQIIQGSIDYHAKWPLRNYQADYSKLVIAAENDKYVVSYRLAYQIKRTAESDWKIFTLVMHLTINTDYKIVAIREARI